MIRLINDSLGRAMHQPLYQRLSAFAEQYTPELPAEPIIQAWLTRLYSGDPTLHIIVNIDEHYTIIEHAVIDVQQSFGQYLIFVHQVYRDKPNIGTLREGFEYIDKLRQQYNNCAVILFMDKHAKTVAKEFDYRVARTMLVKYGTVDTEET